MLARLVEADCRVLVLDNPSRGVDAGARQDIYLHLRQLAQRGVGIVLMSDDLKELIGLGDRVMIMRDGIVSCVFENQSHDLTEEQVVAKMVS
jgi:ribose transport system ATP-binding protein